MKKIQPFFILLAGMILIFSCTNNDSEEFTTEGLRPVYIAEELADTVRSLPAQPISQLGKIYYKDNLLYVAERGQGVHIIDNTDPTAPTPISFIQIPGNQDISIKGDVMYADNFTALVTLDISDFNNVEIIDRQANVYTNYSQNYPNLHDGYFECVDRTKGRVMYWESTTLENPKCRR